MPSLHRTPFNAREREVPRKADRASEQFIAREREVPRKADRASEQLTSPLQRRARSARVIRCRMHARACTSDGVVVMTHAEMPRLTPSMLLTVPCVHQVFATTTGVGVSTRWWLSAAVEWPSQEHTPGGRVLKRRDKVVERTFPKRLVPERTFLKHAVLQRAVPMRVVLIRAVPERTRWWSARW